MDIDDPEELIDEIESIEKEQDLEINKLKRIGTLNQSNSNCQNALESMCNYLDNSTIKDKYKLFILTTYISLISYPNIDLSKLNIEQIFLLCNIMINEQLNDYPVYGFILANKDILQNLLNKSESLKDQLDISEEILDYCDYGIDSTINKEKYEKAISDINKIIDSYKFEKGKQI